MLAAFSPLRRPKFPIPLTIGKCVFPPGLDLGGADEEAAAFAESMRKRLMKKRRLGEGSGKGAGGKGEAEAAPDFEELQVAHRNEEQAAKIQEKVRIMAVLA
jgi:hypothetical protein